MKRLYRNLIRDLYPGEYAWRQLSPEQEERQVQRGRNLAKLKPWEAGRIGKIEKQVHEKNAVERRDFTTGELVRLIYCSRHWDQDFNWRKDGDPSPKVKHWMYERVRKAAPTFADRVGRSTGRGRAVLWRIRPNQYWVDVRARKMRKPIDSSE